MAIDPNGHMLPYASLTMTDDKKYQTVAKGKIVFQNPAAIKVFQDNVLFMLQTRNGKRTGPAAVKLAVPPVAAATQIGDPLRVNQMPPRGTRSLSTHLKSRLGLHHRPGRRGKPRPSRP